MKDKQWKWEQPEEKLESSTEKQESPILEIVATQFLTNVFINFQKKKKIRVYMWR